MTDFIGNPGEEAAYTAFGQRFDGSPRRFGYAGEWGYQSTLDDQTPPAEVFPFLHVGARYYGPATGRFLQRDPIGVVGRHTYVADKLKSMAAARSRWPMGYVTPWDDPGPSVWKPKPKRKRRSLSTEEELVRLKKEYEVRRFAGSCAGAIGGGIVGSAIPGPGTVAGTIIGALIGAIFGPDAVELGEEIYHWDEPPNPLG